jgi:hypothetical protein
MQSRLLPGVYTRRQANGELETQFNVKPGTGIGFRVGFEPETTQYRVKISQANLHLYSLLKDLGTSDKELEKSWGPEIFRANQMKYDARVFDKAYDRLVPARQKKLDKSREDKMTSVRNALEAAQIHARVAQKNLPNMFDPKVAAEWDAKWKGKQAAEKVIDEMPFNPDLEPEQVYDNYFDEDAEVKSAEHITTHTKTLSDGKTILDILKLIEIVKDRQAEDINLEDIVGPSKKNKATGFSEKRYLAADTSYPLILGPGNDLLDGRHRYFKLKDSGETKTKAHKVTQEDIDSVIIDKNEKSAADMHALMQARRHSSQAKEEYKKKTAIMAAALARYPDEFIVDQDGRMSGITHMPTGFRIHVPREVIPKNVKRVFQEDEEEEAYDTDKVAAWKNIPQKVLAALRAGDYSMLKEYGRRGGVVASKVKSKIKEQTVKQPSVLDADAVNKHIQHPDVQHFLSILEKDASAEDFMPDLKPEDIQDAYNAIYGHYGPRLASMDKWPSEWIKSDVDPMGWLQWYEQYKAGRRSEDDDRQIKRWKSFKARHGSQFKKNPTPRRAFALRNWAIDPLKMIEDEEARGQLAEAMENYKEDAWNKYHKSNE